MMTGRHARTAGFSLLELLLSLAVFTILMMSIFSLLQSYAERELARSANKYMTTVAEAMGQILDNVDNFNALYSAAVASGGGYQLIADASAPPQDNIARNFQLGSAWIQGSRLLSGQFRQTSPLRTPVRILLRVADNPAITTDTPALDVVIVTALPRPDGVVRRAANEAGAAGGYIRTYDAKGNAVIQHAYGSWNINPSNGLQATPWYASELQATLNSGVHGSYLAHYTYANLEDKTGDYLYRIRDFDPALRRNTMYGPLNIGGNDIVGADDVNIGNEATGVPFAAGPSIAAFPDDCQGRVFCVHGTMALKGAGSVAGTMNVQGSALIADSMNASALRAQNALTDEQRQQHGAQNLFVVDGNGNDGGGVQDTVYVTGNARFIDGTTAQHGELGMISAETVTMPEGGVMNAANIVDTRRISGTTMHGRTLYVDHQLKAGIVEDGSINVTGGTAAAIDMYNSNNLTYGHAGGVRTLVVPKLNIGTMSIQSFDTCNQGCYD